MSIAGGMLRGILLPADPDFRANRDREARNNHLRRSAVVGAALAHALVIAAMIVDWPMLFPITPLERAPIPVTLVMLPPPPPPQAKPAQPPPPPASQQLYRAVSGADQETTAPASAETKGPEAAPTPSSQAPTIPSPPTPQVAALAPGPAPKLSEDEKKNAEPSAAKPQPAQRETSAKNKRTLANVKPGDVEREGDPYLNSVAALIEKNRFYPSGAVGSLGLPLEGLAVFSVAIAADGRIIGISLDRSAGADVLDKTAYSIIQRSAPFPPPPRQRLTDGYVKVTMPIAVYPLGR